MANNAYPSDDVIEQRINALIKKNPKITASGLANKLKLPLNVVRQFI